MILKSTQKVLVLMRHFRQPANSFQVKRSLDFDNKIPNISWRMQKKKQQQHSFRLSAFVDWFFVAVSIVLLFRSLCQHCNEQISKIAQEFQLKVEGHLSNRRTLFVFKPLTNDIPFRLDTIVTCKMNQNWMSFGFSSLLTYTQSIWYLWWQLLNGNEWSSSKNRHCEMETVSFFHILAMKRDDWRNWHR